MKNEFGFIFIFGVCHAIPLIVPICYHRVIFNCDICRVFVWHFQHNLPGDIRRCESKKLGTYLSYGEFQDAEIPMEYVVYLYTGV